MRCPYRFHCVGRYALRGPVPSSRNSRGSAASRAYPSGPVGVSHCSLRMREPPRTCTLFWAWSTCLAWTCWPAGHRESRRGSRTLQLLLATCGCGSQLVQWSSLSCFHWRCWKFVFLHLHFRTAGCCLQSRRWLNSEFTLLGYLLRYLFLK